MVSLATPVFVSVRALTDKVGPDITKGLSNSRASVTRSGEDLGRAFSQGFNKGVDTNAFRRVTNGLRSMVPEADAARKAFSSLVRTSYTLGTALTGLVGGASAAIGALGALGGAAGGAIATVSVLGNALFALGAGMAAVKLATGGVGSALSKYNKQVSTSAATTTATAVRAVRDAQARELAARRIEDAERSLARVIEDNRDRLLDANNAVIDSQNELTRALADGREELQQIGFDAQDAALAEKRAALDMERARQAMLRTQDLPPNSLARQAAEQAYAEAELNYRKAVDANRDLQAESARLAATGVDGLDSVIDARDRVAKAEADKAKTVKDAMEDEADAVRNLAEARADAAVVDEAQDAGGADGGGGGGAALPGWDDGLNDAQRSFVLFLASLKPKIDELKRIAAEAFLPRLQEAITNLATVAYPTIARGIGIVAAAMGEATITISEYIIEAGNLAKLNTLFESSGRIIETMGSILGRTYDALFSILVATAPMAERFFNFLDSKIGTFANFLNSVEGNAALTDFFARAEFTAAKFGSVFGNIFAGIGAVINANIGPGTGGALLLEYFEKATSDWGTGGMADYFLLVAENATHVLDVVGSVLDIFGDIGANPAIGEMFAIFLTGEDALRNILTTAVEAGPAFATLVVTITNIISALADTGAMQIFFETLNNIFSGVLAFVSDPGNKEFLDFFGRIFAMFSAVGFAAGLLGTGLKITTGIFAGILSPIAAVVGIAGKLKDAFTKTDPKVLHNALGGLGDKFDDTGKKKDGLIDNLKLFDSKMGGTAAASAPLITKMGMVGGVFAAMGDKVLAAGSAIGTAVASVGRVLLGVMLGPVGIVIGVIAALVGLFILLYNTNDQFKKDMDKVWADLSKTFMDAGKDIMDSLMPLVDIFADLVKQIAPLISLLISALVPVITAVVQAFVPLITMLVEALVPIIKLLVAAIVPLITTIIQALVPVIEVLVKVLSFLIPIIVAVLTVIVQVFAAILTVVVTVLTAVITFILDFITNLVTNWEGLWSDVFGFFEDTWNNIVSFFEDALDFVIDLFLNWTIYGLIIQNWETIVKFFEDVWKNIMGFFDAAFKWIQRYVIDPMIAAGKILALAFQIMGDRIGEIWKNVQDSLHKAWRWIDDNVFNPIKRAVDLVQDAFENVAEGIRIAWDGIKRAAAVPINFVIDTVYNNGLRSFFNDVAGNLGMSLRLPRVNTIAFASGGVLPGYTPGRDVHKFYSPTAGNLLLSGGEAIMRPEWVRSVGGPAAVERMNRAARGGGSGGSVSGTGTRAFAGGGILDFAGDIIGFLGGTAKMVGDFISDPGKAVQTHLINGVLKPLLAGTGGGLLGELAGGAPLSLANGVVAAMKKFFESNPPGALGMGWQAQWAIVKKQFPWANLNDAYRPGDPNFHGKGRAVDLTASMDIFNFLASKFPNSSELIYTPAGGRQIRGGKQYPWYEQAANHYSHVHWAMKNGGTVMPSPGGSIVNIAEAGQPERVEPLDPNGISERDKAWAKLFTADMARGDVNIFVTKNDGEDDEAFARRLAKIINDDVRMGSTF